MLPQNIFFLMSKKIEHSCGIFVIIIGLKNLVDVTVANDVCHTENYSAVRLK